MCPLVSPCRLLFGYLLERHYHRLLLDLSLHCLHVHYQRFQKENSLQYSPSVWNFSVASDLSICIMQLDSETMWDCKDSCSNAWNVSLSILHDHCLQFLLSFLIWIIPNSNSSSSFIRLCDFSIFSTFRDALEFNMVWILRHVNNYGFYDCMHISNNLHSASAWNIWDSSSINDSRIVILIK